MNHPAFQDCFNAAFFLLVAFCILNWLRAILWAVLSGKPHSPRVYFYGLMWAPMGLSLPIAFIWWVLTGAHR